MPTFVTHAVVAVALGRTVAGSGRFPRRWWAITGALAMLPDVDIVAFPLGITPRSMWGHRGITHSIAAAGLTALLVTPLVTRGAAVRRWVAWAYFAAAMASHGILDAFTDGGAGVAFFAPLDGGRYFFPWRPVHVSPIGLAFFGRRGFDALASEMLWLWLPVGLLAASAALRRRAARRR